MSDPWETLVARCFGATLVEARDRVRLTQQGLADSSAGRLSRAVIANFEAGRQVPRLDQVLLLADALQVAPASLLLGLPEPGLAEQPRLKHDAAGRDFIERLTIESDHPFEGAK